MEQKKYGNKEPIIITIDAEKAGYFDAKVVANIILNFDKACKTISEKQLNKKCVVGITNFIIEGNKLKISLKLGFNNIQKKVKNGK